VRTAAAAATAAAPARPPAPVSEAAFKDAWLAEVRKGKMVFYSTVVAQAQKIEVTPERIVFSFMEGQRALRDMFEQNRGWLETLAQTVSGRRIPVVSTTEAGAAPSKPPEVVAAEDRKAALKEKALADASVQALLEVFPAEIRDVEEI
jgi:hypothetical protein